MDKPDWSNEFNSFIESALGKELIRSLREDLHDSILSEARHSESMEVAYGLLKEASGVIKAIEHLQFLAAVLPRDKQGS